MHLRCLTPNNGWPCSVGVFVQCTKFVTELGLFCIFLYVVEKLGLLFAIPCCVLHIESVCPMIMPMFAICGLLEADSSFHPVSWPPAQMTTSIVAECTVHCYCTSLLQLLGWCRVLEIVPPKIVVVIFQ